MAIARDQPELADMEIAEIEALMGFLVSRFRFDLGERVTELYTKKLRRSRVRGPNRGLRPPPVQRHPIRRRPQVVFPREMGWREESARGK